jgi:hypothetical protein
MADSQSVHTSASCAAMATISKLVDRSERIGSAADSRDYPSAAALRCALCVVRNALPIRYPPSAIRFFLTQCVIA